VIALLVPVAPGSQVALVWYKFPVNDWWPSAAHQLAGRGGTEAGMRSNGIPDLKIRCVISAMNRIEEGI